MTEREKFPPVQHFIIIHRGRKVALEDSDLQFDNIVSLTFHYTQVWWADILLYLSVTEKCPSFSPASGRADSRHAKHLANQHLMSPISSSITACLSHTRKLSLVLTWSYYFGNIEVIQEWVSVWILDKSRK